MKIVLNKKLNEYGLKPTETDSKTVKRPEILNPSFDLETKAHYTVFETNMDSVLNIVNICLKNRNNNIKTNLFSVLKKDSENSFIVRLTDSQKEFLNLGFLFYKNSHKHIYNSKNSVFISERVIKDSIVLIVSIVKTDNIDTFLLFNKKYVTLDFLKFLHNSKDLVIKKKLKYGLKVKSKVYEQSVRVSERNKQRNKLNKKFNYLTNSERVLLNKKDSERVKSTQTEYLSFMDLLESRERKLENLETEFYKLSNEYDIEKDYMDSVYSENDLYNWDSYEQFCEVSENEISESESKLKEIEQEMDLLDTEIYHLKLKLNDMYSELNRDIKENQFYSNINY